MRREILIFLIPLKIALILFQKCLNKFSLFSYLADEFDAYIIVSFVNATLVLSIGDTVEEVTDSGFLGTTPTICCASIGDDALVQIYPDGIRHIRADRRVNEWKAPNKKTIVKCAVNQRQIVIALSGGDLVYFEMDPVSFILFNLLHLFFNDEHLTCTLEYYEELSLVSCSSEAFSYPKKNRLKVKFFA